MREDTVQPSTLEGRLRRAAPPLRAADPARVSAALDRIGCDASREPLRANRPFVRPLVRAAAGLVLLLSLAGVLIRPQPRPSAPSTGGVPQVATFDDLAGLMQSQELSHVLAGEAANLTEDLADLTDALNESALEILF